MKRALGCMLCFWLLALPAVAENDGGTTSPFSFGAGARDLAQGGANIALASGYTAAYWNPARLASVERFELGGFHSNPYETEVTYQYLGLVAPTLDVGGFALGVFRLGIGGIEKRDAGNLLLGEFEDNRLGFHFAYGRKVSGYDVGAAVVFEHHTLDDYSATSSPGLDLAVQRRFEPGLTVLRDISVSIVGQNLVRPKFKLADESASYPAIFSGGVTAVLVPHPDWQHTAALSMAVTKIDGADIRLAAGLEYSLYDLLHLRSGIRDNRLSFGVGLSYRSFGFDYALVDRDMGSLHLFNLTSSFGSPVSEKRQLRAAAREAAFNGLMGDRLAAQNRETISILVSEGRTSADEGDLIQARDHFDRALFLARANGMDTTEMHALLQEAQASINDLDRKRRYRECLDSAQVKFEFEDYLAARYFANLALAEVPSSEQALTFLNMADSALDQTASREETIQSRLLVIDSLLNYGYFDQALAVAFSLNQVAPTDARVKQALKKATFERHRVSASNAFGASEYRRAITMLDSALALFPRHQWCLDLKGQAQTALTQPVAERTVETPETPKALSREMQQEVAVAYQQAQRDFEAGNLTSAIAAWERVELLTPNYQSVREYLVNAYKYVGMDLYSKNDLAEAVAVWKKARRLAPDNREIGSYIERTETEMRKLQELTYEHE